jgi:hypothetical protein
MNTRRAAKSIRPQASKKSQPEPLFARFAEKLPAVKTGIKAGAGDVRISPGGDGGKN